MDCNLNQFLLAVSSTLDFVEIGVLGATTNHSKRVACVSLRLAEVLGLDDRQRFDLCSLAVLHDNGLSEEAFHGVAAESTPDERLKLLEQYKDHCDIGERNIASFPFVTAPADIIRYHHERYDGSGFFGLSGDEIPLMAQVIALADTVDTLFHFGSPDNANRRRIERFVRERSDTLFAPDLAEILLGLSDKVGFWLDLREPFIHRALDERLPPCSEEISPEKTFEITRVLSRIVDSKSKFTSSHSDELTKKCSRMADHYGLDEQHKWKLLIAASLHDLGKLAVPNSILDKPAPLTEEEFEQIKAHSYYTERALQQIDGFEEITRWASRHHETLDGKGYHHGLDAASLGFEERLLNALDTYQALTEERPYRTSMTHAEAMAVLRDEVRLGRIDGAIVEEIGCVLGTGPGGDVTGPPVSINDKEQS